MHFPLRIHQLDLHNRMTPTRIVIGAGDTGDPHGVSEIDNRHEFLLRSDVVLLLADNVDILFAVLQYRELLFVVQEII